MPTQRYNPNAFGFLINDIARLYRAEIDRRIADAGLDLTAAEARTLMHTARHAPVRQTVLAEHMGIEAMTVSSYLDRLEKAGLVIREADPVDRRAKLVALTDAAGHVLDVVDDISHSARELVTSMIGQREWDKLIGQLQIIRENLTQRLRG
ncbi:DNA-binding MarR family transcriptional regulator [Paenochrobactrum gallinarii]|uniref:DNA-binding MarR family transcriptional regulator n=1 Tax=Paenochrobactrum gallinarii TaxID=643673 RepID=A0A841LTH3_9HYPH|nr:MarR family transcriptional regulator [Paenochrobactrum gallinarii]MBB6260566.1 DNA-binding MarR family transcriptional regulator [Paenochrobactrum gallinarii]